MSFGLGPAISPRKTGESVCHYERAIAYHVNRGFRAAQESSKNHFEGTRRVQDRIMPVGRRHRVSCKADHLLA